jgi:hypothetical protein
MQPADCDDVTPLGVGRQAEGGEGGNFVNQGGWDHPWRAGVGIMDTSLVQLAAGCHKAVVCTMPSRDVVEAVHNAY